jgi:hypothetical protein
MVALLTFHDGQPFAIGAAGYDYRPATPEEDSLRLILQVEIAGVLVEAVVDTGAPYVICTPDVARQLLPGLGGLIDRKSLLIRGSWVTGGLTRLPVGFIAARGENTYVDATVFVPDPDWEEWWGELPSFIGLGGCLERIRFAIDPGQDMFYFGPL